MSKISDTPNGHVFNCLLCRRPPRNPFCQIILNSDQRFLRRLIGLLYKSQYLNISLAAMFLTHQIQFSCFCRGSHDNRVNQTVYISDR